jgi:hypothetical protein
MPFDASSPGIHWLAPRTLVVADGAEGSAINGGVGRQWTPAGAALGMLRRHPWRLRVTRRMLAACMLTPRINSFVWHLEPNTTRGVRECVGSNDRSLWLASIKLHPTTNASTPAPYFTYSGVCTRLYWIDFKPPPVRPTLIAPGARVRPEWTEPSCSFPSRGSGWCCHSGSSPNVSFW